MNRTKLPGSIIAIVLSCCPLWGGPLHAQSIDFQWARSASGPGLDHGVDVASDGNGNIYVTGHYRSDSIAFGSIVLVKEPGPSSSSAIFLAKYDAGGDVLWARSAGGNATDISNGVAVDPDGNACIVGAFQSDSLSFGTTTLFNTVTNGSTEDVFVAKFDPDGNVLWARSAGGSSGSPRDFGNAVAVDGNGNVCIGGYFRSQNMAFGPFLLTNIGQADAFIAKYDASVVAALEQGAAQLEDLRALIQAEVLALTDENLTAGERLAHLEAIGELHEAIHDLLAYHGNALELAANSRALTADGVKATNAAIAAGELIEANAKAVNEVYLSTLAKDIDAFTAEQAEDLLAVANQCPLAGGNAVFRARALYSLIDDEQEYDDAELCLQQGLITKRKPADALPVCLLLPNPAKERATLVLAAALNEPAKLVLTNAVGAQALVVRLPAEQQRVELQLAGLAPGIYHYAIKGAAGVIGTGKIALER